MEYSDREHLSEVDVSTISRLNVASRLTDLPMNNDSNISPHALGMSVKMELEKRRSTQTLEEKETMFSGTLSRAVMMGMSDEISDAAKIIKKLDSTSNSLVFREALATRMLLRTMALKNFSNHNYSDALLEAHYSLLLAKKFNVQVRKTPLSGEMAVELLILSKCYAHIGHFHKGREHLSEFKFLVENTLLQYSKGAEGVSPEAKYAVIECDKKLFLSIVYLLAEILTSYGMWEDAEVFFSKYLTLYSQTYGEFDLGLSSALNRVSIYMLKSKQYLKALPLCIKSLEILKKHLGDYDVEKPNPKVADSYNNLGIVYRLLNNPVDAMHNFFKAIDMKMRIYQDRNHPEVQDVFLSIGCCLHSLGHFTSAASIYREVYQTRSDHLGRTHSATISVQQLLNDLQDDLSLKRKAEPTGPEEEDVIVLEEKVMKTYSHPYLDVARIRALYSNKLENPKTSLRTVEGCQEVIFPTERLLDLSKKLNSKSQKLPVVNVPNLSRGTLYLKDGVPAITLNPDAEELIRSWGFKPPEVSVLGEVLENELTEEGISLCIPIVKDDNTPLLGYHDKPLYVPNPAVYHTALQQNKIKTERASLIKNLRLSVPKEYLSETQVGVEEKTETKDKVSKDPQTTEVDDKGVEKQEKDKDKDDVKDHEVGQKPPESLVKTKIGELERLKSVKFVQKPKPVEEPVVVVPITEVLKTKAKSTGNAKFLAKIGSLSQIKVKQNIAPKIDNKVLKKSIMAKKMTKMIMKKGPLKKGPVKRVSHSPKHKSMMSEYLTDQESETPSTQNFNESIESDNETVMDSSEYIHSTSETPVNSDIETLIDFPLTNNVFTSPSVYAALETSTLPSPPPPKSLHSSLLDTPLPVFLKTHTDLLPLEVARRVKLIKTWVNTSFNNFGEKEEDGRASKNEDESKLENKDTKKNETENSTKDNNATLDGNKTNTETKETKKTQQNLDKNMCVLLDSEGNELAYVPWMIDLVSLSLAKSLLQEDFLKRYSLLASTNRAYLQKKEMALSESKDEEKKKNELLLCRMMLAGQGLEELGFAKIANQMEAITKDLTEGLTFNVPNSILENIKKQQEILEREQKQLEEARKKKEEMTKKEVPSKKAPTLGKKAPPPPGSGKKAPPLKGKGGMPPPTKGAVPKGFKKAPAKVAVDSKVRRFFWDPIFGDDAKDTIFASKKITPKVETDKVEESFAKAAPKPKDKQQESSKPKFIQLLPDSKRSYNMNIGLSKFSKHTFNEIREAIIHLDPNILNVDTTESLLLLLPTNEELSIISEFVKSGGDLSVVDKPEQFVASLIGLPIVKQRLECHQSALTFKDNYNEIFTPLENIMESCEAIMGSVKLNIISHFILNVGNTLNEGDPKKGNAEGFKPTTYPKLNDFRTTTKPSKTLLQYICDIIGEEDENILDLVEDLRVLDLGSKVDLQALDEKMNRFKNDLNKIKNSINLAKNAKSDFQDHFPSIMNEFLRDAEPKVNSLVKHYEEVMNLFKETVRFTGYTEKEVDKVKPNELFKYIWSFAQSVDLCRRQRIEARNKLEKKAQAQLKPEPKKMVKEQSNVNKVTAIPKLQNNDMVNIVKSL